MVTFTGDDVQALFSHPAHQHGLKLVDTDKLFQCDGCRQLGNQLRYRCERCDFDLHLCCAQAQVRGPPLEHSMFEGRALTFFYSRPATPPNWLVSCDVCGDQVLGFMYHNREHNLDLHPFCAFLPERIVSDDGRVVDLRKAAGHNCGLCGKTGDRARRLAYRFLDDDSELVHIHVACLLEAKYSSGGNVTQASSTVTGEVSDRRLVNAPTAGELAMVQYAPRRSSKFMLFCKIAYRVTMFTHSAATLNPLGVIASLT